MTALTVVETSMISFEPFSVLLATAGVGDESSSSSVLSDKPCLAFILGFGKFFPETSPFLLGDKQGLLNLCLSLTGTNSLRLFDYESSACRAGRRELSPSILGEGGGSSSSSRSPHGPRREALELFVAARGVLPLS